MLEAVKEPKKDDDVCTICFKGRCAAPLYWYYQEHRREQQPVTNQPVGVSSTLMDRGTSRDLIQA
jgi:hypothetical protein